MYNIDPTNLIFEDGENKSSSEGDRLLRNTFAVIKFTNEQAIEWEIATRAGQELKQLKEDELFGYGVNMGMGCFMDAEAARTMISIFMRNLLKPLSKTTSTHGTGSLPVFMTK